MTGGASVAGALAAVRARITAAARAAGRAADAVQLVAVSKHHSAASVRAAHAAGQHDFGENRVQELEAKAMQLVDLDGLRWHMVGSLQTNKVRDLLRVPGLALLHSLDRPRLAAALQQELAPARRTLRVLLQIHATDEASKHGCAPAAALPLLDMVIAECPSLQVVGVMAMGPASGDPAPVFRRVVAVRDTLAAASGQPLATISMGMSGDLEAGIAAGATIVRVGTDVFGARGA